MNTQCPICGRPFSVVDTVLADNDVGYQCRHCWNRVRATGTGALPSSRERHAKSRTIPVGSGRSKHAARPARVSGRR